MVDQAIKKCPAYSAPDGSLHPTVEQAAAHGAQGMAEAEADEFVASQVFARGQATRAKNLIVQYLKWKAGKEAAASMGEIE